MTYLLFSADEKIDNIVDGMLALNALNEAEYDRVTSAVIEGLMRLNFVLSSKDHEGKVDTPEDLARATLTQLVNRVEAFYISLSIAAGKMKIQTEVSEPSEAIDITSEKVYRMSRVLSSKLQDSRMIEIISKGIAAMKKEEKEKNNSAKALAQGIFNDMVANLQNLKEDSDMLN